MGAGAPVPAPHFRGMKLFNALARHHARWAAAADALWMDALESRIAGDMAVTNALLRRYERVQRKAWALRERMAALVARRGAEMVIERVEGGAA